MQLITEKRSTATVGTSQTSTFTIAANGKAFKILMDGLYANKELAIVRELWTNAFDSHIAAGTSEKPFECHLPMQWEPWFSVRDFGTGMSHEYMMGGYTHVFHSTKDNSNDQVGALGLGRMSPFSKTDTFTVKTWVGGVERVYSVFLDDNRIPSITCLATSPSDAPSGVEINLPVAPNDFSAYIAAAREVAIGFDLPPKINVLRLTTPKVQMRGTGWQVLSRDDDLKYELIGAHARQGCVVYPLDRHALRFPDGIRAVLDYNVIIDFPIGELNIAANREALAYDEVTIANITKRLVEIGDEISSGFQSQIDACKTMWVANRMLNKLCRENQRIERLLRSKLRWKGREIVGKISLTNELQRQQRLGGVGVTPISRYDLQSALSGQRRKSKIDFSPARALTVSPDNVVLVYEDTTLGLKNPVQRIAHWYQSNGGQADLQDVDTVLWVRGDRNSIGFKRLFTKLGRPRVFSLEDMPLPPKVPSTVVRVKTFMKVYHLKDNVTSSEMVTDGEGVVYIETNRDDPIGPKHMPSISMTTVRALLTYLRQAKAIEEDFKLVIVPATHKAVVKRNEANWITLWAFVENALKQFDRNAFSIAHQYQDVVMSNSKDVRFVARMACADVDLKDLAKSSTFTAAVDYFKLAEDRQDAGQTQIMYGKAFQTYWGESAVDGTAGAVVTRLFEKKMKAFRDTYPMLRYIIEDGYTLSDYKNVIDYVKLIDSAQSFQHTQSDSAA